jgi:hypothetical protein
MENLFVGWPRSSAMQIKESFNLQLRSMIPALIKLYMPVLVLLLGIGLLGIIGNVKIGMVTRDPIAIVGGHPFMGVLSNIGILFWCSSTAICFFCTAIIWKNEKKRSLVSFLFFSGLITSLLMIDDFFLFHDFVFPNYLHISEECIYIAYMITVSIFLILFRHTILQTDYIILCLSLVFFGLSILFDIIPVYISGHLLLEDGFKFFGIVSWMLYFIRVCSQCLNSEISITKQGSES